MSSGGQSANEAVARMEISSAHDEQLRMEIIESQKTEADFLKWKLISVAALAAASLGLGVASDKNCFADAEVLICFAPLVCAYIDLICLHLKLRIITVGSYLKHSGSAYEDFVFRIRDVKECDPFVFETKAMLFSSAVIDLFPLGVRILSRRGSDDWSVYIGATLLGVAMTRGLWVLFEHRKQILVQQLTAQKPDLSH